MNGTLKKVFLIALLLPAMATADVKSYMADSSNSLVNVMSMALADGLSAADAVAAMIKADPSQANAIIATGMVVAPDQYAA
ncbi:MAG: hypothetical protein HN816_13385, partial [Gammaproteobacteria bacterium]|nr:hypothetical protein [Gammaproteobacteria bacterium]